MVDAATVLPNMEGLCIGGDAYAIGGAWGAFESPPSVGELPLRLGVGAGAPPVLDLYGP